MSRLDFISLAGLRPDGRRPMEIRRMRCKLGVLQAADGSAYIEMGQTKVIAKQYREHMLVSKLL
jgi:exosome complex component RRP41